MIYTRGTPQDFNAWADDGNPTWDWDNVLKYFKKSEDNRSPIIAADTKHHSIGGPLKIETTSSKVLATNILVNGLTEMGYENLTDINGDKHLGVIFPYQSYTYQGKRLSTAKAFLVPAKDRSNLHIIKHAHVTTFDFTDDYDEKSVSRVNFVIGNDKIAMSAKARKEFILSAGALGSPQILLNSGIGPQEVLDQFDIKSVKYLSVGKNLQDHIMIPVFMTIKHETTKSLSPDDIANEYYNYLLHGNGLFAGSSVGLGFINTLNNSNYPDIQFFLLTFEKNDPNIMDIFTKFGYNDEILDSIQMMNEVYELACITVLLLNPKSTGRVELHSTDPFDQPKYISNFLENSDDLETLLRGFKIVKKLQETDALKIAGFKEYHPWIPGCLEEDFDSDDYTRCYIRHLSTTVYHPAGTTKMGPDNDEEAVVDSRLKVKGVKGLRVIDAGIMPNIVSATTNAAAVMIGEKGADFIKEDWSDMSKDEL